MDKKAIVNFIGGAIKKIGFQIRRKSPEILIGTGVVGFVGTTVMACRATTKISGILEKSKDDVNTIKEYAENETDKEKYSEKDKQKDLIIVYAHTGIELVKLYGPSLILGALSISSIIASNGIHRNRNAALTAAYATVDASLKEHRRRFIEKYGEDAEKELRYGIKAKKVEDTVLDENGKEKKTKSTVKFVDPALSGDYSCFFDNTCSAWDRDPDYNLQFLKAKQCYMNNKLQRDGFVFLNDVYDELGLPRTRAGQVVGWIYDENNAVGDNHIDFGIYETHRESSRDHLNGVEQIIVLDFNVDGPILDRVFKK